MGLAAATALGTLPARVAWVLAAAAVAGQKSLVMTAGQAWRTRHRAPAIANLWVSPGEDDEWSEVRRLAAGRKAVVVSWAGAAFEFAPEVEPRMALYLMPTYSCPSEVTRQSRAITEADMVIMRNDLDFIDWSLGFSEISRALTPFHATWRGRHFEVLQRASR